MPIHTYTALDDPSARTGGATQAFGINASGQIVGSYTTVTAEHGFLLSGGNYTNIDDPLATLSTDAFGINASGQIVGQYRNASGTHGFLYSSGTYTTLDDPSATNLTVASRHQRYGPEGDPLPDRTIALERHLEDAGDRVISGDLDAPGFSLLVEHVLNVGIEPVPFGQHATRSCLPSTQLDVVCASWLVAMR